MLPEVYRRTYGINAHAFTIVSLPRQISAHVLIAVTLIWIKVLNCKQFVGFMCIRHA